MKLSIRDVRPFSLLAVLALLSSHVAQANLNIIDGFQVEQIYSVPKQEQGSWVSLANEKNGRMVASDQNGKLYRLTIPKSGKLRESDVEPIDVTIGRAQGLLYAFDALYVMVNSKPTESGLYRVTDRDNDDKYDTVEMLQNLQGAGEHGPHAILLAPDAQSLFILGGNHTKLPPLVGSAAPAVWKEDLLLPRMWDANGHAKGIMAPGGWICQVDKNGKNARLVASGFRNQYDAAFDANGELFTYDSDMEWDVGLPWYRPTRILHCTSGAEFGWRSGTGKWPEYYVDSLPAVVDIGPGSPTGVVFGTGAKFPKKYQRALFAADWSYGKLYAIHLEPTGGSFHGTAEAFLSGTPLPITDLVVRPTDGAMYFTTGGRGVASGLFRITAESPDDILDQADRITEAAKARKAMEAYHRAEANEPQKAMDNIQSNLSHEDRHVRFAARLALEKVATEHWRDSVFSEDTVSIDLRINRVVALARVDDNVDPNALIESLGHVNVAELSTRTLLDLLRAGGLVMARHGDRLDNATLGAIAEFADGLYPADDWRVNRELCNLMVATKAPNTVAKTLELLRAAETNEDRVHFLTCLRNSGLTWTLDQRSEYLRHFVEANRNYGGHSYGGFVRRVLDAAVESMPEFERIKFADLIESAKQPAKSIETSPRKFVKQWTVDQLLDELSSIENPAVENGKHLFATTECTKCHRHSGWGGTMGPDLTAVKGRFSLRDLLSSMVEPSKNISDQYQMTTFELNNGKVVTGRIVNLHGDKYNVMPDMTQPDKLQSIRSQDIEGMEPSPTSAMPSGLLDTFTAQEVADLVAYLRGE